MEAASHLLSEILLGSCAAAAGLLDCGSTHTHSHTHTHTCIYILSGSTSVVLMYKVVTWVYGTGMSTGIEEHTSYITLCIPVPMPGLYLTYIPGKS